MAERSRASLRSAVDSNANSRPATTRSHERSDPPKIGIRLRHARKLHGLSLEYLGSRVGLTEGYLSKIENDLAMPSMAALHKIAQELSISLNRLFSDEEYDESQIFVLRHNERPRIKTGHRQEGNHVILEQLVPSGAQYLLQVNIHVVGPGDGSPDFISHKGQEFGLLLEGSIDLHVDGNTVHLEAGDAFHFSSELGHGYKNSGEATARVLWVNTPPTF